MCLQTSLTTLQYVCAYATLRVCIVVVIVCWCISPFFFFSISVHKSAHKFSRLNYFAFFIFEKIDSWLCGISFNHCWRPYGNLYLLMFVSFYHIWRVVSYHISLCFISKKIYNDTTNQLLLVCMLVKSKENSNVNGLSIRLNVHGLIITAFASKHFIL